MVLFKKKKVEPKDKNFDKVASDSLPIECKDENDVSATDQEVVDFKELQALSSEEESRLIEIKDSKILAQIDNFVPRMGQVMANGYQLNELAKSGEHLYQVIIPRGTSLAKSRKLPGAFRGFYQGAKGIEGQANLKPIDIGKAQAGIDVAMGVAAMVVGQYYMNQINDKLEDISRDINEIKSFLEAEYEGKIAALLNVVKNTSDFQFEIIANEKHRDQIINRLNRSEEKATELLGAAINKLNEISNSSTSKIDFKKYAEKVHEADKWCSIIKILLQVLAKIAELSCIFGLGEVSLEQCYATFNRYNEQVKDAQERLIYWHWSVGKELGINFPEGEMKRGKKILLIPFGNKKIPEGLLKPIKEQIYCSLAQEQTYERDFLQEDVKLITKDGKWFYLPNTMIQ